MKNQIFKLVDILSKHTEINFENNKVYELSVYISVKYALLSNADANSVTSSSNDLYEVLRNKYPHLVSIYESIQTSVSEVDLDITNIIYTLIHSDEEEDAIIISDIYQHIKSYLLNQLISQKTDIGKVSGKELLFQTQFFTDTYMVDYLLDKVIDSHEDLENILFVDPASGGGNFLALVYIRLYKWYLNKGFCKRDISGIIFNNNILGYDLDSELSEIASLSLFMLAYKNTGVDNLEYIYNFGGTHNDYKGFLNDRVVSNTIGGVGFEDVLKQAKNTGKNVVYVTNPPFMGKRDMDSKLKNYLLSNLPIAKGDMCFSFMLRIMQRLNDNDTLAVVAQNGWMNLSTMKGLREYILNNVHLQNCIDLGSNAFKNINGEKTNVVLAIFSKKKESSVRKPSEFVNLRNLSLGNKIEAIKSGTYQVYDIDTEKFRRNKRYEFSYQLGDDVLEFTGYPVYGDYAKCMQGTSTGSNSSMVKYIWEKDTPEWKLASKGGGFSKWEGLNIYKVKWGKTGECIKENRGGVLRNPSEMPFTQLVFSDTGTLGLNVRSKLKEQVFIASGPGIKVLRGDPMCHMAFLNSKFASFLMKIMNPKFTISGGYIQNLPVAKGILDCEELKTLSMICLDLKTSYLRTKLPNAEFRQDNYNSIIDVHSYIESCIKNDFQNMYERLVAERLIDAIVLSKYKLSKHLKQDYQNYMSGYEDHDNKTTFLDTKSLDKQLAKMIGASCFPLGKKVEGKLIGSENCLEILSYHTGFSCSRLIECIYEHTNELKETIDLYKADLIHKIILDVCGIADLTHVVPVMVSIQDLKRMVMDKYPVIFAQLALDDGILISVIKDTHNKVFYNTPILKIV